VATLVGCGGHTPDAQRLPCARALRHAGWQRQSELRFTARGAEGERFGLVGGVGCKGGAGVALETEGEGGQRRLQLLGGGGGQRAKGHGVMVQPHLKTDVRTMDYNCIAVMRNYARMRSTAVKLRGQQPHICQERDSDGVGRELRDRVNDTETLLCFLRL